jgi:alkylhydroperoxidase family enzyme
MSAVNSEVRVHVTDEPSELARELIQESTVMGTPHPDVFLVLDAVPELMRTFYAHWRAIYDNGVVDRDLKELVRRKLASTINCATCRSVAIPGQRANMDERLLEAFRWRDSTILTDREKAALWLVDCLLGLDDDLDGMYEEAHRHLRNEEIIELGWFAGINIGTMPFLRSWRLHDEQERGAGSPGS